MLAGMSLYEGLAAFAGLTVAFVCFSMLRNSGGMCDKGGPLNE